MRRGTKTALLILTGVAIVAAGGIVACWVRLTHGPDSLVAGIAAYHNAGLAWTSGEVLPTLPADQDAGPQILEALAAIKQLNGQKSDRDFTALLKGGETSKAGQLLAPFNSTLSLIAQAVKRPHAVIPHDWDQGPYVPLPEIGLERTAGRLLCDRAVLKAKKDDVVGSDADIVTAWTLSARVGEQPFMISLLAQMAMRLRCYRTVERCAALYAGHLASLKSLQSNLAGMGGQLDMRVAERGDAYAVLAILRNFSTFRPVLIADAERGPMPPNPDFDLLQRSGDPKGLDIQFFGGRVLIEEARLAAIAEADRGDSMQMWKDLTNFEKGVDETRKSNQYAGDILYSVYTGIADAFARQEAQAVSCRALIEAMIMRTETGHFPTAISDLPSKWVDPIDGQPLRMKVSGETFKVYSIGPDMRDDGGLPMESKDANEHHYDVVASYPPFQSQAPSMP